MNSSARRILVTVVVGVIGVSAVIGILRTNFGPVGALPSPTPSITATVTHRVTAPPNSPPLVTPSPAIALTEAERQGQTVSGPRFSECSSFDAIVEEGEVSIAYAVSASEQTLIGEILEIGGARYNIPDGELTGERPVDMFDVYRPTILRVVAAAAGGPADGFIKLRLPGGELGCDQYQNDRTGAVNAPGRYVVFLGDVPDRRGNDVPEMTIVRAWPIDESSRVVTPNDGEISVEEFLARVSAI